MPTIVPPDGPLTSKIAIVGARPGRDECNIGKGFVGPSGNVLWSLLRVPRSSCYVTNVRKDYSPKNSVPTRDEIREILPSLREELSSCRANIFIALGAEALFTLTGKDSISDWRGSILESSLLPGRKVLGTWHPASTIHTTEGSYKNFSWRYVIDIDLRRAVRESNYPDIRRPEREFSLAPDFEGAVQFLRSLGPIVSVDIETFGEQISCVGFSDSPRRAIVLPFIGGHYSVSQLASLWREIDVVLRTRQCRGQNFQFDVTRLEQLGFYIPNIAHDTMLSHHLLWTELGGAGGRKDKTTGTHGIDSLTGKHSLAFITSQYTEEPYYKDESEKAWQTPGLPIEERFRQYWTYNGKDCCVTQEAGDKLEEELIKAKQLDYYREHVLGLIRPVMAMQARGILVDRDKLASIKQRQQLEADYLQMRLNQLVGFSCNVRSTTDLRYLLHERLSLPRLKLTKKGQPSTDEDTLRRLAYNSPYEEIFRLILDIRERRTLISGFLGLEASEDGRYYAAYLIHGTDSGRLSSRATHKGPQLQNIPKAARKIFRASPGCIFVQGDLSKAEARYVAYDSQCRYLIDLFEDPKRNLYKEFAAASLGKRVGDVTGVEYETFKRGTHGSNYDMGPLRLVAVLRLNNINILDLTNLPGRSAQAKAEFIQDSYFKLCPEIRRWQDAIKAEVFSTRTLHDSFGRRRVFLGKKDDALARAAYSYKPQATIVGIANRALRLLHARQEPILLQVHDSVVTEPEYKNLSKAVEALQDAMTCPLKVKGRTLTIPVDIQYGENWGELRDWKG